MANVKTANTLLSLDMVSTSIGWCLFGLDARGEPAFIIDIGARTFSDGRDAQSKTPLAVARRAARSMSRRRDRYLRRRRAVLRTLVEYGLLPADEGERKALLKETGDRRKETGEASATPYALRAKALIPLTSAMSATKASPSCHVIRKSLPTAYGPAPTTRRISTISGWAASPIPPCTSASTSCAGSSTG